MPTQNSSLATALLIVFVTCLPYIQLVSSFVEEPALHTTSLVTSLSARNRNDYRLRGSDRSSRSFRHNYAKIIYISASIYTNKKF